MQADVTSRQADATELALTRSQLMMWTGQNLQPSDPLYNMVLTFRLRGHIDEAAFRAAFRALLDNSDALRTTFVVRSGVPRQRILDSFDYDLPVIELEESAVQAWISEHAEQDFDLSTCLFESVLIRLSHDDYVWFFNQHHLTTDAWSTSLIFANLRNYYMLALEDRLDEATVPPPFAEYVEYETRHRESKAVARAERYWNEKLATPLVPSEFFRPTPPKRRGRTSRVPCLIGSGRSQGIRDTVSQASFAALTQDMAQFQLFATVLLAWLYRVTGNTTLTIGTPNHNRTTSKFKRTIGPFIEIYPLRVEIDEAETFETLYAKVARQNTELLMHAPSGGSGFQHNRAYDVVLNYITAKFGDFNGIPVESEWVHANHGDRNHLVRMQVEDFDISDEFRVYFDLNADTFVGPELDKPGFEFTRLMDQLLDDPGKPVALADILDEEERRRCDRGYNFLTDMRVPDRTVFEMFLAQVESTPDAIALACGEEVLTYGALQTRIEEYATTLHSAGVESGDRVAVALPRTLEAVVGILSILRLGAAYIPVDPDYPEQRIAGMLEDAGARWLLSDRDIRSAMGVKRIDVSGYVDDSVELPDVRSRGGSTAYVIFTSGSTGRPKGVEVSHRSLANYIGWAASYYIDDAPLDWPLFSSLSFDLTVTSMFVPLVSGGRIVVYPDSPGTREIIVRRVVEDNRVDIIKLTPAHLALLQAMDLSKSRIRKFIVGGENLKSELARSISSYCGDKVEIYNEYGPTEATVACMVHRFDPDVDNAPSVPIGQVIENAYVYILNEAGVPQAEGTVGELYIGGAGVAKGYANQPGLTAESFVGNPFRAGESMYRSGDLARRNPDGTVTCLGRADEQFKLNGIRMEPGEIEAAVLAHPDIAECAVRLVERSPRLEEDTGSYCVRCGLSGAHPEAMLDDESVCNLCRVYEEEEERAQSYFCGSDELQAIVDDAKAGATGKQDCMMLLSGGKDSTYALCQLVELGLTPLVFSLDNGYISDGAKANIRRVVDDLGLELIEGSTPAMNAIFVDSLNRFSNVCNGCFKAIYTLCMQTARERGIRHIFTGLSRGQIFETRVADLFRQRIFDPATIDRTIIAARKAYHREHDAVYECMDTSHFDDDSIFEEIQFVDYYRYTDVSLDTVLEYLRENVSWVRPADTGRSTNCLINEAGIFVHKKERRYHNYALPYSWDVRLGHKDRDAARDELDDDINVDNVRRILGEIGYTPRETGSESEKTSLLVGYYVADSDIGGEDLRATASRTLPDDFVPVQFVRLDALPMTPNGKLDRGALPEPELLRPDLAQDYAAPETAIEAELAEIWADILGVNRVGIDDGFFELGGDSIMNIQIVAAAGKRGIRLSPQQVFDHPTIRELASVVDSASEIASQQGPVVGDVPLTPIQRHYLGRDLKSPERYCQYVVVRCASAPDSLVLQEAVRQVTTHHDALRAQFHKDASGWRQELASPGSYEATVRRVTVDDLDDDTLQMQVAELQQGLALAGDLPLRVLVLDLAATGESFLLLLASHLVVDAVSWWILVEDLEQAYGNLAAGKPVRLMPKTTSMPHWSRALVDFASSESAAATLPLWQPPSSAPFIVPCDDDLPGNNDQEHTATIELSLDRKTTRRLLKEAVSNWRLQPQELMLTAFATTMAEWLDRSDVVIDLEGHGREPVSAQLDLLRTVGWFTALYPVHLSIPGADDYSGSLRTVKKKLRSIPNGGIAYGALRYLADSPDAHRLFDGIRPAPLLFNYLGQWRRHTSPDSWLAFEKPVMARYGTSGPRQYVFEVNAAVFDGELRIAWTYGSKYHHRRTVSMLANRFVAHIRALTALCASGANETFIPQDFPDADLSDTELDDILAEFGEG